MAITRPEIQVEWDGDGSTEDTVGTGSTNTSDSILTESSGFDATAIAGSIHCKADHSGTPSSGDTVDFYLLYSCGDPDGASAAEYADTNHAVYLCTLDLNQSDPAQAVVPISVVAYDAKLYVENNGAATVTVSATIREERAA